MLALLALLLAAPSAHALPPEPDDTDALAFKAALERMQEVRADLTEYQHLFYSREWVSGAMKELDVIEVRYRAPMHIAMRWIDGPHEGRVLLYRGPDWNKGRMRINPGRFIPVMSLDPQGGLARRGTRHTLADLPLPKLIDRFLLDATKVAEHPTWTPQITDEGTSTVRGEPTRCFQSLLPKQEDPSLYAHKVRICIHPETGLPNALRVWDHEDGALRLVEEYDYIDFETNPGFDELTFEPSTYGL